MSSIENPENLTPKKSYKDLTKLEKATRYAKKFALQKTLYIPKELEQDNIEQIVTHEEKRKTKGI